MVETTPEARVGLELKTRHLDEMHATVERLFHAPCRLDGRPDQSYRAHLLHVPLGPITFTLLEHGIEIDIRTVELGGGYLLQVPLAGAWRSKGRSGEAVYRGARAQVINPGERFSARFTDDMRMMVVRFDERAVKEHLSAFDLRPSDLERQLPEVVSLDAAAGASLARAIDFLRAEAVRPEGALARGVGLAHATNLLTSLFVAATGTDLAASDGVARRCTPRYVRRAVDFMAAHLSEPLTASEIVAASGASMRTLYGGFAQRIGVPPMEWLRQRRLDAARRELTAGRPDETSVTEVATRFGFLHLGRFAAQYRERFGESPSETLGHAPRRRRD